MKNEKRIVGSSNNQRAGLLEPDNTTMKIKKFPHYGILPNTHRSKALIQASKLV